MTDQEALKTRILDVLVEVAPDCDPASLDPEHAFRDQFEFDSVDFLNFALGLEKAFGVHIPEYDYPRLSTLNGSAAYLTEKTGEQPA